MSEVHESIEQQAQEFQTFAFENVQVHANSFGFLIGARCGVRRSNVTLTLDAPSQAILLCHTLSSVVVVAFRITAKGKIGFLCAVGLNDVPF